MDQDKTKRIQHLKVIASEIVMVVAVILTVSILALIVSGYWLNADFKVERQGLLQVSSIPTGADVNIDGGSSWLQRTNTSKTLSSGEHSVTLSKEGYDTWSKTINIREGLLYRLHYPRLFLENREVEIATDVSDTVFATISPDRSTLLLTNHTTKWQVISLNEEKISPHIIDVGGLFTNSNSSEDSDEKSFAGQIIAADWANDNAHVLLNVKIADATEWVLIDIDNIKDSINLSQKFDMNFDDIQIMNNSASTLFSLQDQNLRKIDVASEQISAILAEKIVSLDHYENEVIYVANQSSDDEKKYTLNTFKLGDDKTTKLDSFKYPAKVVLSKFYDDKYITMVHDNTVTLYNEADYTMINEFNLSFNPASIKVGHNGEFVIMNTGSDIATLDMEALAVVEWDTENEDFGWLDNDMIYDISDEKLIVYDFDGLNRREIAKDVDGDFPATITDNKWLYYFSNGSLMREWLIER